MIDGDLTGSQNQNRLCKGLPINDQMELAANNNEEENPFLEETPDYDQGKYKVTDVNSFWEEESSEEVAIANIAEKPSNAEPLIFVDEKNRDWLEEHALKEFKSKLIVQKSYKTKTTKYSSKKERRSQNSRPKRLRKREPLISSTRNNFHDERLQELDCSSDSSDFSSVDSSASEDEEKIRKARKKGNDTKGIRSLLHLKNIGEDPRSVKRRIASLCNGLPAKLSG